MCAARGSCSALTQPNVQSALGSRELTSLPAGSKRKNFTEESREKQESLIGLLLILHCG